MRYLHPWQVIGGLVGGDIAVTVGQGFVNGYEPRVGGRAISGVEEDGRMSLRGPPVITAKAEFDAHGRTFVCVRVRVDAKTGRMPLAPGEDDLTVVIEPVTRLGSRANMDRAKTTEGAPTYWNQPLAVFSDTGYSAQVAHFHYQHFTAQRAGRWFHFFSPA